MFDTNCVAVFEHILLGLFLKQKGRGQKNTDNLWLAGNGKCQTITTCREFPATNYYLQEILCNILLLAGNLIPGIELTGMIYSHKNCLNVPGIVWEYQERIGNDAYSCLRRQGVGPAEAVRVVKTHSRHAMGHARQQCRGRPRHLRRDVMPYVCRALLKNRPALSYVCRALLKERLASIWPRWRMCNASLHPVIDNFRRALLHKMTNISPESVYRGRWSGVAHCVISGVCGALLQKSPKNVCHRRWGVLLRAVVANVCRALVHKGSDNVRRWSGALHCLHYGTDINQLCRRTYYIWMSVVHMTGFREGIETERFPALPA